MNLKYMKDVLINQAFFLEFYKQVEGAERVTIDFWTFRLDEKVARVRANLNQSLFDTEMKTALGVFFSK